MNVLRISTILAQTGTGGESSLLMDGALELPFPVVGAIVGIVFLGVLLYWAHRLATRDER